MRIGDRVLSLLNGLEVHCVYKHIADKVVLLSQPFNLE